MQLGLPFGALGPPTGVTATGGPPAGGSAEDIAAELQFVRRRRARRYVLRVDGEGRVVVTIPRGGSQREAVAFGLRHLDWIVRQRAARRHPRWTSEERQAHRRAAMEGLPPRVRELAAQHGLEVSRVSIRDQRTRWGSCGADGHICLNWRLVLMPAWVRDYVIVHELMHLRRMDHSPRYWALVAAACEEYRAARRWLREHGPSLR